MRNIDDWLTFLEQITCFNHNTQLIVVNSIKLTKQNSPRLRKILKTLNRLIAMINHAVLNKWFKPHIITCNTTRWRLLCLAFERVCYRINWLNLIQLAEANDMREWLLYSRPEIRQIGQTFEKVASIHDIFESSNSGTAHQVIIQVS